MGKEGGYGGGGGGGDEDAAGRRSSRQVSVPLCPHRTHEDSRVTESTFHSLICHSQG